jgi:hypothetical protein
MAMAVVGEMEAVLLLTVTLVVAVALWLLHKPLVTVALTVYPLLAEAPEMVGFCELLLKFQE